MSRRLLFIVNDAGYFRSHRLPVALAARDAGWDVHVATAPGPAQAALGEAGLSIHDLPLTRAGLRPDRELGALLAAWRLLRRLRPDLVHCVALKAVVVGGLAAGLAGVPARVFAIAGLGHVFTAKGLGGLSLRVLFRALLPLLVRGRARLIVQNLDDMARVARSPALRAACRLIPGSGVDLTAFQPAPEPDGPITVLLASRMIRTKGIADFVEAARRLRAQGVAARFLLCGASDPGNPAAIPEAELEAWHREGTVEWLGRRDDVPALMAACHVFCLPSYYGEGVPKVLQEAAAAGRPAVTTDMPGCRDVVRDGESGLLVPPQQPARLAEALGRLIEDGALRRRLGAQARARAEREFGLERVVEAHLAIYRELVP